MFADMAGSLASSLTETPTRLVGAGQCGAGAGQLCSQADIRCQGDLGSPLLAGTHSNTILGLMPGYGGCTTSQYGLFTRLASEYRSPAPALADGQLCRVQRLDPEQAEQCRGGSLFGSNTKPCHCKLNQS